MLKQYKLRKDIKLTKGQMAGRIILAVLLIAATAFVLLLPKFSFFTTDAADFYSEYIFPAVSALGISICNLFFTSLTECIIVSGVILLVPLLVVFIVFAVKNAKVGRLGRYLSNIGIVLLVIVFLMSATFELMHGINYRRTPVAERFGITGDDHTSYEDYTAALNWAYQNMMEARSELGSGDYNGVAHIQTNVDEAVYDANGVLDAVGANFDLGLSPVFVRAKPVSLSHYWSATGIVGIYDTFIGEANLNTDYLDILEFPITVCHEIAHAKGYAREYDANTVAVIACISSTRADFRYAGYYRIFCDLYDIVSEYSEHENKTMYDYFSESGMQPVIRDIKARINYWNIISETPFYELIHTTSEKANNTYLEANGQEGGTDTYQVDSNIYVNFYFKYVHTGD